MKTLIVIAAASLCAAVSFSTLAQPHVYWQSDECWIDNGVKYCNYPHYPIYQHAYIVEHPIHYRVHYKCWKRHHHRHLYCHPYYRYYRW